MDQPWRFPPNLPQLPFQGGGFPPRPVSGNPFPVTPFPPHLQTENSKRMNFGEEFHVNPGIQPYPRPPVMGILPGSDLSFNASFNHAKYEGNNRFLEPKIDDNGGKMMNQSVSGSWRPFNHVNSVMNASSMNSDRFLEPKIDDYSGKMVNQSVSGSWRPFNHVNASSMNSDRFLEPKIDDNGGKMVNQSVSGSWRPFNHVNSVLNASSMNSDRFLEPKIDDNGGRMVNQSFSGSWRPFNNMNSDVNASSMNSFSGSWRPFNHMNFQGSANSMVPERFLESQIDDNGGKMVNQAFGVDQRNSFSGSWRPFNHMNSEGNANSMNSERFLEPNIDEKGGKMVNQSVGVEQRNPFSGSWTGEGQNVSRPDTELGLQRNISVDQRNFQGGSNSMYSDRLFNSRIDDKGGKMVNQSIGVEQRNPFSGSWFGVEQNMPHPEREFGLQRNASVDHRSLQGSSSSLNSDRFFNSNINDRDGRDGPFRVDERNSFLGPRIGEGQDMLHPEREFVLRSNASFDRRNLPESSNSVNSARFFNSKVVETDERSVNQGTMQLNGHFRVEERNSFSGSWTATGQDMRHPEREFRSGNNGSVDHLKSEGNYSSLNSDRFLNSKVDERDGRSGNSWNRGESENYNGNHRVKPPSNVLQGSWETLNYNKQAGYPQIEINHRQSLTSGPRKDEELAVRRSVGNRHDLHFDPKGNTQNFELRPPLDHDDHRLANPSAAVQYQARTVPPCQNLPPHMPQQQPPQNLQSHIINSRPQLSRVSSDAIAGSNSYRDIGTVDISKPNVTSKKTFLPPQVLPSKHSPRSKVSPKKSLKDERVIIDASHLFCKPHRTSRPEHIVLILRGLPGSGKSYLAKAFRDLEVENGGSAPRIHCIDDYFMAEVETAEEKDVSTPGSVKGKKQTSTQFEYCYEPEMEEAYRSSMLKAFKKTVEEKIFSFAIVDDRNLRVADFAQFWAAGKRSGYEVYLVEAPYKDPAGCAARNIHGFTLEDIKKMHRRWEEAPPFYLQLDIQKTLFSGDNLDESNIQEVDMDMEDTHEARGKRDDDQTLAVDEQQDSAEGSSPGAKKGDVEEVDDVAEPRELGKSKWSVDLDDDDDEKMAARVALRSNSLSGLIQAYSKRVKSVHWADQAEKKGFSIGASRNLSSSTLVIGPGPGYNLESNPHTQEEDSAAEIEKSGVNRKRKNSLFLDHSRAERESFRAVFDGRRRQRVGGLDGLDD